MVNDDGVRESEGRPRQAPLQFRLRTMLLITVAVGLVVGVLRWLEVPPRTSLIVLVVLSVSVAAALGLVVVIAGSITGDEEE